MLFVSAKVESIPYCVIVRFPMWCCDLSSARAVSGSSRCWLLVQWAEGHKCACERGTGGIVFPIMHHDRLLTTSRSGGIADRLSVDA